MPRLKSQSALPMASHDGEFELISQMSDASKRLGDDQLPLRKKSIKKGSQRFPDDESPLISEAYVKEMLPPPYPGSHQELSPSVLPEGIRNLAQWGTTEVRFGKFKGKGMSYSDLFCSKSEEVLSYLMWARNRRSSAGGELADLANYIHHMDLEEQKADPTIGDGASTCRIFKA